LLQSFSHLQGQARGDKKLFWKTIACHVFRRIYIAGDGLRIAALFGYSYGTNLTFLRQHRSGTLLSKRFRGFPLPQYLQSIFAPAGENWEIIQSNTIKVVDKT
jgi:hypothetical protein